MSLPKPETGLVISYSYLWRYQHEAGAEYGRKNRPCVIVVSVEVRDGDIAVTVAPITHQPPVDHNTAIELPSAVKKMLNLDSDRSWVMVNEANQFIWPGFDLEIIPGVPRRYAYGFLPPGLFSRIKAAMAERFAKRQLMITRRQ